MLMNKIAYPKEQKSFDEQIALLKQRGMYFEDEVRANCILQNVSYYRLSGYWYPLLKDKQRHIFKDGASFDNAYSIYKFDSALRKLVLSEIEKIEIAVRTQFSYIMSQEYDGWWFTDSSLFSTPAKHAKTLAKVEDEYNRSDEDFIVSFKAKYCNRFPPSWITLEITSLGTMSILYSNLKGGRCRRQIAKYFGVADTIMVSWLHTITYVRNICAHHSRLWNKTFGIAPMMPRRTTFPFVTLPTKGTQHVYFVLCMIQYLLNIINPSNTFRNKINVLLEEYPNIDIVAMGFPENWKEQLLWKS